MRRDPLLPRHVCLWVCVLAFAAVSSPMRSTVAEQVRLANGDVITVTLKEVAGDHVTFVHPVLGTITVPAGAIEILPADAPPATTSASEPATDISTDISATQPTPLVAEAEGGAAAAVDAEGAVDAGAPTIAPPEPPAKPWKFKFTLAGAGATGNTENLSLATAFTGSNKTERNAFTFDIAYYFATTNGDETDNKLTAGFQNNFLIPGQRHFYFVDSRFDYDTFNTWVYRLTGHVGVGYKLFEPEPLSLNGLLGIGFNKEWDSPNENIQLEGLVGLEGKWEILKDHSIVFSSQYYPNLSDFDPYQWRWVNNLAWSWKINREEGLALTAGLTDEYQSEVSPDRQHNDLRFYAGVDWQF